MTKTEAEVLLGIQVEFKIQGQFYIGLSLAERYPHGGNFALRTLGKDLVVHPQQILDALLSDHRKLRAANSTVFEEIFEVNHQIPEFSDEHKPSLSRAQKRDHLRHLATRTPSIMHKGRRVRDREPAYYDWAVPGDATIIVPLSKGMVDVIEKSRRWTAIKPRVEAFETKVDQLADAVIGLRKALSTLCSVGQHGLHEVGMLVGLSQYCDLLLDQEGNPEPGQSALADFQEFLQRSAIPRFNEQIVCNPVDIAPEAAERRDRHARKIMTILDDPAFIDGVKLVVEHHDVVPHALLDDLYYYLTAAADLLSVTEQSERFAEDHALPMMRGLAELAGGEYEDSIDRFGDSELRDGMRDGWRSVLNDKETVFKLAMGIGTGVIGSVSNLEGPRSVGVAVMMQYQVHLFDKAVKSYKFNIAAFERATAMFLKHFGEHNELKLTRFRSVLAEAIHSGKPVVIDRILARANFRITRGPFRGRATRGIMALLAISIFTLTLASKPDDTLASNLTVASTAGTVGIATLDWAPIANAMEKRWGRSVSMATGRLAGVVGAIGVIANGKALIDAWNRSDDLGIVEGTLSTLGSGLSMAGWLMSLKYGALVFAPSLMMTAGSVLIIAGLGIAIWRTFSPKQPLDLVNATLDMFQDADSRASIAGLRPTVETLVDMAGDVDFRPLNANYGPVLAKLGHDDETVAAFMGTA